jgi:hypothetical protein
VLDLALSPADRATLLACLRGAQGPIRRRIGIHILDKREKVIESLDVPASRMVTGAVTVDATATVTRSLAMTFVDPLRRLGFDAASPGKGAIFADNMIAVRYAVEVDPLGWIEIPVFWGPVTTFERDAASVTIEAQGKEALALDPHFATQGYTIAKGRRVDNAIRDVMDRMGETRYHMPDLSARLAARRAIQADDEPWDIVKFGWASQKKVYHGKGKKRRGKKVDVEYNGLVKIAGHYYPFYNGRGQLTVRRRTTLPMLTFQEGRDLLTVPTVKFDALAARNHVVVTGATVTVGKKHVQRRASATLPPGHPLSPYAIGRNGKARYMSEFVDAPTIKTQAAAVAAAKQILAVKSAEGLDLSFDSLPFPMLEELDYVTVQTGDYSLAIPLETFTIPLDGSSNMTIGYTKDGVSG